MASSLGHFAVHIHHHHPVFSGSCTETGEDDSCPKQLNPKDIVTAKVDSTIRIIIGPLSIQKRGLLWNQSLRYLERDAKQQSNRQFLTECGGFNMYKRSTVDGSADSEQARYSLPRIIRPGRRVQTVTTGEKPPPIGARNSLAEGSVWRRIEFR